MLRSLQQVPLSMPRSAGTLLASRSAIPSCGMGIVQRDDRRIYVSEAERPFVRPIAGAFDAYLPKDHKRHSVAL
jgi:hypothetical protein